MEKSTETHVVSRILRDIIRDHYDVVDYDRHALPSVFEDVKKLSDDDLFELGTMFGEHLRKNNKYSDVADKIISMMNELKSISFDNGVLSEGEIHFVYYLKDSYDTTPERWERSRFVRVEYNPEKRDYRDDDEYFLTRSSFKNLRQGDFENHFERLAAEVYYPDELYEIACNTKDFEIIHSAIDRLNDKEFLRKIAEDSSFAIDQRMRAAKKYLPHDEYLTFLVKYTHSWRPYSMYDLRTLTSDDLFKLGLMTAEKLRGSKYNAYTIDTLILVMKELRLTAFEDGLFSQGDIQFTREIQVAWENKDGFYDGSLEWIPANPLSCDRFEEQIQYLTRNGWCL